MPSAPWRSVILSARVELRLGQRRRLRLDRRRRSSRARPSAAAARPWPRATDRRRRRRRCDARRAARRAAPSRSPARSASRDGMDRVGIDHVHPVGDQRVARQQDRFGLERRVERVGLAASRRSRGSPARDRPARRARRRSARHHQFLHRLVARERVGIGLRQPLELVGWRARGRARPAPRNRG